MLRSPNVQRNNKAKDCQQSHHGCESSDHWAKTPGLEHGSNARKGLAVWSLPPRASYRLPLKLNWHRRYLTKHQCKNCKKEKELQHIALQRCPLGLMKDKRRPTKNRQRKKLESFRSLRVEASPANLKAWPLSFRLRRLSSPSLSLRKQVLRTTISILHPHKKGQMREFMRPRTRAGRVRTLARYNNYNNNFYLAKYNS